MNTQSIKRLIDVAKGEILASTVLKGANVVNVYTNSIQKADVAIIDGKIAGIGSYDGKIEVNCEGKYVVPAFIDSHLHMESSMVSPTKLLSKAVAHGTTTFIADPHEIVNVSGKEGFEYMLEATKNVPANVYLMMPSCIPKRSNSRKDAEFGLEEMKQYLNNERVLGLGEVMDFPAVMSGQERMLEMLDCFKNKIIDGHSPGINQSDLVAYAAAGVMTDHECSEYDQAKERLQLGMYVQIRSGSVAKNLDKIVIGALKDKIALERFLFCTDDKHVEDIEKEGHISFNIRRAIQLGMDPIWAYKIASINAAQAYGLKDIGAIAPNKKADIVILDDFENVIVNSVYKDGQCISIGRSDVRVNKYTTGCMLDTIKLNDFTKEKLSLKPVGKFPVICVIPGEILTAMQHVSLLTNAKGEFLPNDSYQKIAVIERHGATGKVGVGAISGYGLKKGAIASTISHDEHNIIVVGTNDKDMVDAVRELERIQGGYAIACNGKVQSLKLEVAGLFTQDDQVNTEEKINSMLKYARELGVREDVEPLVSLSFMAITCIPFMRITEDGVYDVSLQKTILEG